MAQKDLEAPRDPGFRVPRNGFPTSPSDWLTMDHLYRKAFEEGLILTRSYELVLPEDGMHDEIINQRAAFVESNTPLRFKGTRRVPIEFAGGRDTLNIYKEGQHTPPSYSYRGALCWTPETGFNLITPMIVRYPISELLLVDPETMPSGKMIGRDQCVIDLDALKGKRFGEPIRETVHRSKKRVFLPEIETFERDDLFLTDKVPRAVLCQFEYDGGTIYPVDWMDESREFLSRPDVQAAYNRAFAFSAFERKTAGK